MSKGKLALCILAGIFGLFFFFVPDFCGREEEVSSDIEEASDGGGDSLLNYPIRYEGNPDVGLFAIHGLWVSDGDPQVQIETRKLEELDDPPAHLQCRGEGEKELTRFAFRDLWGWMPGDPGLQYWGVLCESGTPDLQGQRVGRLLWLGPGFNDGRTFRFFQVNLESKQMGRDCLETSGHCHRWGFVNAKQRTQKEEGAL